MSMGQICPLIEFTWKLLHHASNIRVFSEHWITHSTSRSLAMYKAM